jgi:coproporphyrinogen III oxidase-like Fe-S oxidoreductase
LYGVLVFKTCSADWQQNRKQHSGVFSMAKSIEKAAEISIPAAVALSLQTKQCHCTAKQCMKEILTEVRELTRNAALTVSNIKAALREWLREGWAVLSNTHIQITRAGRAKIKEIAEKAAQDPLLA